MSSEHFEVLEAALNEIVTTSAVGTVASDQRETMLLVESDELGRWIVTLTWGVIEGRWTLVGLRSQSVPPRELSSKLLRLLASRVRAMKDLGAEQLQRDVIATAEILADAAERGDDRATAALRSAHDSLAAFDESDTPQKRRTLNRTHFQNVARVYEAAWKSGRRDPRRAVAEHFAVSESTAGHWVQESRTRGLMGATSQGKAGAMPKKRKRKGGKQ